MAERRVVVTGVGLVSPVGIGTEETWKSLQAGRSGAGPITLFDASQHSTRFACEVKGFDPLNWVEKKDVKKMDRFIQFAVAAADLAVKDSALPLDGAAGERVGVYVGVLMSPAIASAIQKPAPADRVLPDFDIRKDSARQATVIPATANPVTTMATSWFRTVVAHPSNIEKSRAQTPPMATMNVRSDRSGTKGCT